MGERGRHFAASPPPIVARNRSLESMLTHKDRNSAIALGTASRYVVRSCSKVTY